MAELQAMDEKAFTRRLRVAGDVEPGSIARSAGRVEFTLQQEGRRQKVVYTGREPLPDTFKDHANAMADGALGRDGVFEAKKVQAKCASKYEAKPGAQPGSQPVQTAAPRT
ncbi:MAG: cytochrome c maturation protein CcmE [Anaerolineales bacterium]